MSDNLRKFEFYTKVNIKEIYSSISALQGVSRTNLSIVSNIKRLCVESINNINSVIYYRLYSLEKIPKLNEEYFNIDTLENLIEVFFKDLLLQKNIQLNIDLDNSLRSFFIFIDIDKYLECLDILVRNSVTASQPFSTIKISIYNNNETLCTRVIDTGEGVPEYLDKDNIFKSILDTKFTTGLGLFLLSHHVNLMNKVSLNSPSLCEIEKTGISGTVMKFNLPLVLKSRSAETSECSKEICILFQDNTEFSEEIIDYIHNLRYIPLTIRSLKELRIFTKNVPIKCIFSNYKDVKTIRSRHSLEPPIVCITKKNFIDLDNIVILNPPITENDIRQILDSI